MIPLKATIGRLRNDMEKYLMLLPEEEGCVCEEIGNCHCESIDNDPFGGIDPPSHSLTPPDCNTFYKS